MERLISDIRPGLALVGAYGRRAERVGQEIALQQLLGRRPTDVGAMLACATCYRRLDLLEPAAFKEKVETNLEEKNFYLKHFLGAEPMDADDWLKTIEKKLQVVQCNNREKVLFGSHQLIVPAADWWDAYVEAHEEPESINWQEFKNSFRSHHVPLGVMKLKKKEFEELKQGSMSVSEYVTRFTQLSRYAPDNVDTNEKKQDWFLNGLNDGLA